VHLKKTTLKKAADKRRSSTENCRIGLVISVKRELAAKPRSLNGSNAITHAIKDN